MILTVSFHSYFHINSVKSFKGGILLSKENGISIVKSTFPLQRTQVIRAAKKLISKKVFIETLLFNYRGRLISLNEDYSLNVIILASDEVFREIRIDLPLIIEIGELSCKKNTPREGYFSNDDSWQVKLNQITVKEKTSSQTQAKINHLVDLFIGQVVIVQTLIYHYVVCILDSDDDFITVRQLIDFDPNYVIEFRIDKNIIYDIVDCLI